VRKSRVILTYTSMEYFIEEIQELFKKFVDIVVDDFPSSFPPIKSINHHIDLILGEIMSNKSTYKLTPQENEEVKRQL
jgi:hypothetical protein